MGIAAGDPRRGVFANTDDLVSIEEAAVMLGIGEQRFRRLVRDGRVPTIVMSNGRNLWLRQHLLAYIADREWWGVHDSKVGASRIQEEA